MANARTGMAAPPPENRILIGARTAKIGSKASALAVNIQLDTQCRKEWNDGWKEKQVQGTVLGEVNGRCLEIR